MTINDGTTYSEQLQDAIEPITHIEKEVIVVGCDHRGFVLRDVIRKHLLGLNYDVMDVGTHNSESCDYPNIANALCKELLDGSRKGILICGSGFGMSISANRKMGVHAVTCRTVDEVEVARQHGDVNVLCIGSDFTSDVETIRIIDVFLNTKFSGEERFVRRIKMIDDMYDEYDYQKMIKKNNEE